MAPWSNSGFHTHTHTCLCCSFLSSFFTGTKKSNRNEREKIEQRFKKNECVPTMYMHIEQSVATQMQHNAILCHAQPHTLTYARASVCICIWMSEASSSLLHLLQLFSVFVVIESFPSVLCIFLFPITPKNLGMLWKMIRIIIKGAFIGLWIAYTRSFVRCLCLPCSYSYELSLSLCFCTYWNRFFRLSQRFKH